MTFVLNGLSLKDIHLVSSLLTKENFLVSDEVAENFSTFYNCSCRSKKAVKLFVFSKLLKFSAFLLKNRFFRRMILTEWSLSTSLTQQYTFYFFPISRLPSCLPLYYLFGVTRNATWWTSDGYKSVSGYLFWAFDSIFNYSIIVEDAIKWNSINYSIVFS